MSDGPETQILDALLGLVKTTAAALGLPVAWPAVSFEPTTGSPYLAVSHLPATARADALARDSGSVVRRGILQVSVYWPDDQGLPPATRVADQLVAAMGRTTDLSIASGRLTVNQEPSISPPVQEADWLQLPVSFIWCAITTT